MCINTLSIFCLPSATTKGMRISLFKTATNASMCRKVLVTRLCPTIESTRRSTHENPSVRTQSRTIKISIKGTISERKYSSTYDCISCSWRGCKKTAGYQTACSVLCDLRINTPSNLLSFLSCHKQLCSYQYPKRSEWQTCTKSRRR